MVEPLVTLEELRVWTRSDIDDPSDVLFAESIIDAVSLRVGEELGFADWLADPADSSTRAARHVALMVARRTYLNPDQQVRTAAIGPIGGVAYREDFAAALELTESELDRLSALRKSADGGSGGLGILRIERDDVFAPTGDIVLNDSAAPGSAGITYAHISDAMWFYGEDEMP